MRPTPEIKVLLDKKVSIQLGTYFLSSPGNGKSGARLKCPIKKIATVPMMKRRMAAQKHTLSIIFPIRTQFSISFSWKKRRFED